MALQSSGAIKLSDVATEFSATTPYALKDFYRGGTLVPDTAANAGVPTSGSIQLKDFYGAASFSLSISGALHDPENDPVPFTTNTWTLRFTLSQSYSEDIVVNYNYDYDNDTVTPFISSFTVPANNTTVDIPINNAAKDTQPGGSNGRGGTITINNFSTATSGVTFSTTSLSIDFDGNTAPSPSQIYLQGEDDTDAGDNDGNFNIVYASPSQRSPINIKFYAPVDADGDEVTHTVSASGSAITDIAAYNPTDNAAYKAYQPTFYPTGTGSFTVDQTAVDPWGVNNTGTRTRTINVSKPANITISGKPNIVAFEAYGGNIYPNTRPSWSSGTVAVSSTNFGEIKSYNIRLIWNGAGLSNSQQIFRSNGSNTNNLTPSVSSTGNLTMIYEVAGQFKPSNYVSSTRSSSFSVISNQAPTMDSAEYASGASNTTSTGSYKNVYSGNNIVFDLSASDPLDDWIYQYFLFIYYFNGSSFVDTQAGGTVVTATSSSISTSSYTYKVLSTYPNGYYIFRFYSRDWVGTYSSSFSDVLIRKVS